MKNKLTDLNDLLFAQLERLADEEMTPEEIDRETKRGAAMVAVADQIIAGAGVQLAAAKLVQGCGKDPPGLVSLNVDGIEVMSREDGAGMLLSVLSNPQNKIVSAITDGEIHERAAVAEACNYSATSGGFANLLGSLSTFGIINYPMPGKVQLAPWAHELLLDVRIAA